MDPRMHDFDIRGEEDPDDNPMPNGCLIFVGAVVITLLAIISQS
jgi:hypothetical protein